MSSKDNSLQSGIKSAFELDGRRVVVPQEILTGLKEHVLFLNCSKLNNLQIFPIRRFLASPLAKSEIRTLVFCSDGNSVNSSSHDVVQKTKVKTTKGSLPSSSSSSSSSAATKISKEKAAVAQVFHELFQLVNEFIATSSSLHSVILDSLHQLDSSTSRSSISSGGGNSSARQSTKQSGVVSSSSMATVVKQHLKRVNLALIQSKSVKWFCCRNCPLGDKNFRYIVPALIKLPLQVIMMESCQLTDTACQYIASILKAHEARMGVLLWNASLRASSQELARQCVWLDKYNIHATGLMALSLKGNHISAIGLELLKPCLIENHWLLGLKLSDNQIHSDSSVIEFMNQLSYPYCALQVVLFDGNNNNTFSSSSSSSGKGIVHSLVLSKLMDFTTRKNKIKKDNQNYSTWLNSCLPEGVYLLLQRWQHKLRSLSGSSGSVNRVIGNSDSNNSNNNNSNSNSNSNTFVATIDITSSPSPSTPHTNKQLQPSFESQSQSYCTLPSSPSPLMSPQTVVVAPAGIPLIPLFPIAANVVSSSSSSSTATAISSSALPPPLLALPRVRDNQQQLAAAAVSPTSSSSCSSSPSSSSSLSAKLSYKPIATAATTTVINKTSSRPSTHINPTSIISKTLKTTTAAPAIIRNKIKGIKKKAKIKRDNRVAAEYHRLNHHRHHHPLPLQEHVSPVKVSGNNNINNNDRRHQHYHNTDDDLVYNNTNYNNNSNNSDIGYYADGNDVHNSNNNTTSNSNNHHSNISDTTLSLHDVLNLSKSLQDTSVRLRHVCQTVADTIHMNIAIQKDLLLSSSSASSSVPSSSSSSSNGGTRRNHGAVANSKINSRYHIKNYYSSCDNNEDDDDDDSGDDGSNDEDDNADNNMINKSRYDSHSSNGQDDTTSSDISHMLLSSDSVDSNGDDNGGYYLPQGYDDVNSSLHKLSEIYANLSPIKTMATKTSSKSNNKMNVPNDTDNCAESGNEFFYTDGSVNENYHYAIKNTDDVGGNGVCRDRYCRNHSKNIRNYDSNSVVRSSVDSLAKYGDIDFNDDNDDNDNNYDNDDGNDNNNDSDFNEVDEIRTNRDNITKNNTYHHLHSYHKPTLSTSPPTFLIASHHSHHHSKSNSSNGSNNDTIINSSTTAASHSDSNLPRVYLSSVPPPPLPYSTCSSSHSSSSSSSSSSLLPMVVLSSDATIPTINTIAATSLTFVPRYDDCHSVLNDDDDFDDDHTNNNNITNNNND